MSPIDTILICMAWGMLNLMLGYFGAWFILSRIRPNGQINPPFVRPEAPLDMGEQPEPYVAPPREL